VRLYLSWLERLGLPATLLFVQPRQQADLPGTPDNTYIAAPDGRPQEVSKRSGPRLPVLVLAALIVASPAAISLASTDRTGTIDTQVPAVSVISGPTGPTNEARPTFGFASPDSSATFSCSVDTGTTSFGACSGANEHQPPTGLADGFYTFRVKATDPAGNSITATRSFSVDMQARVDSTPPTLAVAGDLADADDQPLVTDRADAQIQATDDASGDSGIAKIEVSVDDAVDATHSVDCNPSCPADAGTTYTYRKSDWPHGPHTVTVTATDAAGNVRDLALRVDLPTPQAPVDAGSDPKPQVPTLAEKNGAPQPVRAWYMNATNTHDLMTDARDNACAFARRQPNATRLMLLNFGQARKREWDGTYGARLTLSGTFFSNDEILQALKAAADRYRRKDCHYVGSAVITYGNTNHMRDSMDRSEAREAGRLQAETTHDLLGYQRQQQADHPPSGGGYEYEGVAVAGDIEPGWNDPEISKDLVRGANGGDGGYYFDFGNVGPCGLPIQNNWSLHDLGVVSRSGFARPLPEIYDRCNAGQWVQVRNHWLNYHSGGYRFHGVTSQPISAGASLTATEGWEELNARSDGRVGPELVNIRYSR